MLIFAYWPFFLISKDKQILFLLILLNINFFIHSASGSQAGYPSTGPSQGYPSAGGPPSPTYAPSVPSTGYAPGGFQGPQGDSQFPGTPQTPTRDYLPPRRG